MPALRPLFRRFPWLDRVAILLVIAVGILSYKYEDFKEQFPGLITLQLWAYQGLTNIFLPTPHPKWVVPVEIDGATFYEYLNNQSRNDLTDRKYLAGLIEACIAAKPAVIALDINFDAATSDRGTADPNSLNTDDQMLFNAILDAQRAGIPVVLTYGFREGMVPVAQVFDGQAVLAKDGQSLDSRGISFQLPEQEEELKDRPRTYWVPRYGFDHPADDLRKVPLVVVGPDPEGRGSYDYYSFALQAADAYSRWAGATTHSVVLPPLPKQNAWLDELAKHEFVYTTFIPPRDFVSPALASLSADNNTVLSAIDVYCPEPDGKPWKHQACPNDSSRSNLVKDLLHNKIVLIGGNRHGYKGEEGDQDFIDDHQSPVGRIRGMYFQANYIEGLLDNRVLKQTPRPIAAGLDVVLALLTLAVASSRSSYWARAGVIALVLLFTIVISGIVALTIHYCLDFVFPLVLLLLHPAIESYIHLVPGFRHEEGAHD